ncbi:dipeptidase PepV [Fructilactobacillus cliffordii]|uniref:Dipeptidase PepV n=1 Tax=Fructilactobacillus cliffordii TaxID=2940299 RepID=A0A9Q8ZUI9_9LACO|nr:dipeptidase PepV [Fructilactobacillus cliffordii]USS89538.1 dipeptidase PepV [Fructilactobacillus cliffordii]
MTDWKATAAKYQDQYLADLKQLVAIDSSRDVENQTDEFPLGPGPAKALDQFLDFGKRDGFTTKNIDNVVGYIEYGTGDDYFAILGHADTVPAGNGWDTNPFELLIQNGQAIGRGTSDDKGPALAAYYGLRILKDLGIEPKLKIRLIIGTDEETNWTGMNRYFETEPAPTAGFSPDAEFPLINGEKGNVTFETHFTGDSAISEQQLLSFKAGLKENMVPRDAEAFVTMEDPDEVMKDFDAFIENAPVSGVASIIGKQIHFEVVGKAAHGMEPRNGINAGTYLAMFLKQLPLDQPGTNFIRFITNNLHDDSRARQLGLQFTDEVMGDLTMNVGLMDYDAETGGVVNTNFRYPKGITPAEIQAHLEKAATPYQATVTQTNNMEPHFVPADDQLVTDLMNVYKEQTGETNAQPEVVGGGTFARLMEHGVAFGALFPSATDTMHQANEFQPVADLMLAMSIYAQAIFTVTK